MSTIDADHHNQKTIRAENIVLDLIEELDEKTKVSFTSQNRSTKLLIGAEMMKLELEEI